MESAISQQPVKPPEEGHGEVTFVLGFDHGRTDDAHRKLAGKLTAHMHWLDARKNVRGEQKRVELAYPAPRRLVAWHVFKAMWLSWIFSEDAIELLAPVWLACGAALVSGFRIGIAFVT